MVIYFCCRKWRRLQWNWRRKGKKKRRKRSKENRCREFDIQTTHAFYELLVVLHVIYTCVCLNSKLYNEPSFFSNKLKQLESQKKLSDVSHMLLCNHTCIYVGLTAV